MNWLMEAEEKLGVAIPDDDASELRTVGQFLRYLREHGASWPPDSEIRLVQEGGCWRRYRWEAVARRSGGE
jgi:hypothetical protein